MRPFGEICRRQTRKKDSGDFAAVQAWHSLRPHIYLVAKRERECKDLKGNIEERACKLAAYIIENGATVRSAARKFGISKSTVHKDLSERLPAFNRPLYLQVKGILDENKAQRHIRGGMATRRKYKGI